MRASNLLLLSLPVLGAPLGCGWTHAPGHAELAGMTKTSLPAVKPQLCQAGACDLEAPGGLIHLSDLHVERFNGRRSETAFKLGYLGATASCFGPAVADDAPAIPFACSIAPSSPDGSTHVLTVLPGCTTGTLTERSAANPAETSTWDVRTDVAHALGFQFPGREVALSDRRGVMVFSDDPNTYDLTLFTRPHTSLTAPQTLAVVALHAFQRLDGHPPECLVED